MARREEGAYSREICDRRATKPAAPPRRKIDRNILRHALSNVPVLLRLKSIRVPVSPRNVTDVTLVTVGAGASDGKKAQCSCGL